MDILKDKAYTFAGAILLRAHDYCPECVVEIKREQFGLGVNISLNHTTTYHGYEFTWIDKLKDPAASGRSIACNALSSLLSLLGKHLPTEALGSTCSAD